MSQGISEIQTAMLVFEYCWYFSESLTSIIHVLTGTVLGRVQKVNVCKFMAKTVKKRRLMILIEGRYKNL